MTKLRGRKVKPAIDVSEVVEAVQDVGDLIGFETTKRSKRRHTALPKTPKSKEDTEVIEGRKTTNFSTINITGSKGQKYTVTVPTSIAQQIPRKWSWTAERYRVAELIASGIPISQIPDDPAVHLKSRMTIYGWLEHPEFKDHIDGLVTETGWANRRERLNNLKRLNDMVFNKVAKEISSMKLTEKNVGALLGAIQTGAKMIAQEKGEIIEESKVVSEVSVAGTMTTVTASIEELLNGKTPEERAKLEKEFDDMGDDIIRSITGDK